MNVSQPSMSFRKDSAPHTDSDSYSAADSRVWGSLSVAPSCLGLSPENSGCLISYFSLLTSDLCLLNSSRAQCAVGDDGMAFTTRACLLSGITVLCCPVYTVQKWLPPIFPIFYFFIAGGKSAPLMTANRSLFFF